MTPRKKIALDLFCGGGGSAEGIIKSGYEVIGIDNKIHSNYPGYFILGDALNPPVKIMDFDLIWASPPCQKFSIGTRKIARMSHPDYIELTRKLINQHPYTIIENVPNAPIRADLKLTGSMVGLMRIERKRHFEISWPILLQPPIQHIPKKDWLEGRACTITTSLGSSSHFYPRKKAGLPGTLTISEAMEVMGITTKMTKKEIGEAVPPAMVEYIIKTIPK